MWSLQWNLRGRAHKLIQSIYQRPHLRGPHTASGEVVDELVDGGAVAERGSDGVVREADLSKDTIE